MKKLIFILFFACNSMLASAQSLTMLWKTDTLLRVPESVLLDSKNNVLYVSCIDGKSGEKDGKGYIAKVSPDGKIITNEWVSGLDAPKGLGLYKNNLYVADLTRVVTIDITTGKITSSVEVEGAQFLNDVTVDSKGNVYISDSNTGKITRLANGKAELFFESKDFTRINGLLALKDGLRVADFGSGAFYNLSWDKKLGKVTDVAAGSDGIVMTGKNEFIISCWAGEVYFVAADGKVTKLLDTKDQKVNSADVDYNSKSKTLYVPTFFANSVVAYTFNR
ncbi:MAG TPA: ATP/GTP-binding protein [Ohtaekwangia sp.]